MLWKNKPLREQAAPQWKQPYCKYFHSGAGPQDHEAALTIQVMEWYCPVLLTSTTNWFESTKPTYICLWEIGCLNRVCFNFSNNTLGDKHQPPPKPHCRESPKQHCALCNAPLTTWVLASMGDLHSLWVSHVTEVTRVLPVTAASPAHACGGRGAAEEPVLTAFSHVATEMFDQSLRLPHESSGLLPSASSLPLQLWECQKSPSHYRADFYELPL